MKITLRSDKGTGGHLLVSVPGPRLAEVESALNFLEARRQQRGSHIIVDLIVQAARRNGWQPVTTIARSPERPQGTDDAGLVDLDSL